MHITPFHVTLVLALATGCAPYVTSTPAPSPVAGSRIRYAVRADTTQLFSGRLVSLDAERMVFERFIPGNAGGKWVATSLPTEHVARLQVQVGRRDNIGRGALIGGGVGLVLGALCAVSGDESQWLQPSDEECLVSGAGTGLVTGLLIGALVRSDVMAPAVLPGRAEDTGPAVTLGPGGVVARIPFRVAEPAPAR